MRLSLCVITKNEENNIEKCLNCLSDILFEKIVVDTGSSDKTIEIAKNLGADVYKYAWKDDFSAARNYAISKAEGDWIIFLDADEYFDSNQSKLLYSLIRKADKQKKDCILNKIINYIPDSEVRQMQSITSTIRVFKNDKNIRYVGAIHEVIKSKNKLLNVFDASENLVLYHTGYSRNEVLRKDKSNRNLSLLYKELNKKPTDALILFYIAESLMIDDKFEEAVEYLNLAKKYVHANNKQLIYKIYCNLFVCKCSTKCDLISIEELYREAMELDSKCPDFSYYLGRKHGSLGNIEKAIEYFEICIGKISVYRYSFESHVLSRINNIYEELLNLYLIINDNKRIVETSTILLKVNKYDYKSLYILINKLKDFEHEEHIYNFLFKIYSKVNLKDKLYLLKAVDTLGLEELYNLIFKLLSSEEKEYFLQNKEQGDNSVSEFEIESKNLAALECFQRGEFYKKKNNILKSLFFHKLAYEKNPNITSDILLFNNKITNYEQYIKNLIETLKQSIINLISQKSYDGALKITNELLKIITNDSDLYSIKAVININIKNYEEAKEMLRLGLINNPEHVDCLYNLAFIYEDTNQKETAFKLYNKILHLTKEEDLLEEIQRKIINYQV